MTRSLAQKRADDALTKIETMAANGGYGKYKSYVSSLPAEILMSGLGQAMALAKSKKKLDGYDKLYQHLSGWLCAGRPYNGSDLIREIAGNSEADYIRAQAEAMAYLEWLKKFAVALLEEDNKEAPYDPAS